MPDTSKPITITYPNGQVASKIIDLVVRNKPIGWSRKSYATYYREEYAEQLKKELDNMIDTKRSKVFRYDIMPNLSPTSIYLWINQSFRYILDNLDPDKKYAKLYHSIKIERIKSVGVTISYRDLITNTFKGEDFVARQDKVRWTQQIDDYLSNENVTKPLHIQNLILTPEEVAQLKSELEDLSSIQYSVTSREIKLIKTL